MADGDAERIAKGRDAALSPEAPLERRVRARVNTEIDMTCKHGWNWKQHETCPMCEEVNAAVAAERAAWMKAVTDEPELPSEMPDEMWNVLRSDRDAATETLRIIVRQTKGGILTRGMRSNV